MKKQRLLSLTLLLSIIMFTYCTYAISTKKNKSSIRAAIVPGSDFIGHFQVKSARKSEIVKKLEESKKENTSSNSEIVNDKQKKLKAITGIGKDDVISLLVSGDMDSIDFINKQQDNFNCIIAIQLAKPISDKKLKAGIEVLSEDKENVDISNVKIGNKSVIMIKSDKPDNSVMYAATSSNKRIIFFAFSKTALQNTLNRDKINKYKKTPPKLSTVEKALLPGSQIRMALLAPESFQNKIKEKIAKTKANTQQKPGAGMMLGLLSPFQNIKSLSLGIKLTKDVDISIAGEFGSDQEALQLSTLIQAMVIPMISASIAKKSGKSPQELINNIKVKNDGPSLSISAKFTEKDLIKKNQTSLKNISSP